MCRLHRHRRTLAERAIEDEAPAALIAELIQLAVALQALLHLLVGDVDGAWDDPILVPLLILPEIDQGDLRLADEVFRFFGAEAPTRSEGDVAGKSPRILVGMATSIIFGLGRLSLLIKST